MNRTLFVTLVLALCPLVAFAAASEPSSNKTDVEQVTWADQVAPLLYEKCASCHRPDQVAPMSLLSYSDARPWAKSIRKATTERTMPPWFANPEHGDFVEDSRLSDDEIALLQAWVEAGAPSGDLASAPEPPTFSTAWQMGEPDVILTMDPFQVTDDMEDHYQWVQVTNPLDEDRWIKAMEVRPSFMAGAHHNLTYIAPPGSTVESIQGLGRTETEFIVGWAPGVRPMVYREGYGKLLPANSTIFFQMHYHKDPGPGTGGIDETSVGIKFYDDEVENKVATMWIVDPVLRIPPGEANYVSKSSVTFEHDVEIFNFTPHMHLRGKAMRFTATGPDGEQILLDVPEYDFNWQLTYSPSEPLVLPAGTTIALDAVFDNSADNPANPDPSAMVTFGEATSDEMMIGFMDYTFVEQDKQVDMPTYAVPEGMREQFDQIRRLRQEQKAKAESEGSSGRD